MVTVLRPLTSMQFQFHHEDMKPLYAFTLGLCLLPLLLQAKPSSQKVAAVPAKVQIKVLAATGSIDDFSQNAKASAWNKKSKVTDRLALSLKNGSQTKIQLHPQIILTAYENTEFEIPFINWDTRQFKEIKLAKGVIRLEVEGAPFDFTFSTPFFQVHPPVGQWVFAMDLERALVDVLSLKGDLELTSLNSEDKAQIKTGERVTFRGLLEEGEISYDLLLHGRKVPKGKWTETQKLTKEDEKAYSLAAEKRLQNEREKAKALSSKEQLKKQAGHACRNPSGDFNECRWKLENNQCMRSRCAADGVWKDAQIVAPSFCDKKAGWSNSAKKCDY